MRVHCAIALALLVGDEILVRHAAAVEVSRWQFDGTTADSVGGRNGTLQGDATYSTDVPPGLGGMSLRLDGTLDKMAYDVQGADALQGSFTVAAWVKLSESRALGTLSWFGTRHPTDGSFDFKARLNNTSIRLDIGNGATFPVISDTAFNLGVDEWHHVAVAVQPNQYELFVDCVSVATVSYASFTPLLWDATHDIGVGAISADPSPNGAPNGEDFAGWIDDVRVFDTALTLAEIEPLCVPEPTAFAHIASGMAIAMWARGRARRSHNPLR